MQLIDDCLYGSSLLYFEGVLMSDVYGGRPDERPLTYVRFWETKKFQAS